MQKYDLEKRTSNFGSSILIFCKSIKKNIYNISSIKQLIRSSTSVGANYREANDASSRKDFRNKIYICKKEINETKHWLKMLITVNKEYSEQINTLYKEAQELNMIFQKIVNSLNSK